MFTYVTVLYLRCTLANFNQDQWKDQGKAIPLQVYRGPEGSRRFRREGFSDSLHMKMARLLAIRTGRLYHSVEIPSTYFC
jgi:hypothetical protein